MQAINGNGKEEALAPKLINGRVWISDPTYGGGYRRLPESDPAYQDLEFGLQIKGLLNWIGDREKAKPGSRKKEKGQ